MPPPDPINKGKHKADSNRKEIEKQRQDLLRTFSDEKSRLERLASRVRSRSEASGYIIAVSEGGVDEMDFYIDVEKVYTPSISISYKKSVSRKYGGEKEVGDGRQVGTFSAGQYGYNPSYPGNSYQRYDDDQILEQIGYTLERNRPKLVENNREMRETGVGCLIFIAIVPAVGLTAAAINLLA